MQFTARNDTAAHAENRSIATASNLVMQPSDPRAVAELENLVRNPRSRLSRRDQITGHWSLVTGRWSVVGGRWSVVGEITGGSIPGDDAYLRPLAFNDIGPVLSLVLVSGPLAFLGSFED